MLQFWYWKTYIENIQWESLDNEEWKERINLKTLKKDKITFLCFHTFCLQKSKESSLQRAQKRAPPKNVIKWIRISHVKVFLHNKLPVKPLLDQSIVPVIKSHCLFYVRVGDLRKKLRFIAYISKLWAKCLAYLFCRCAWAHHTRHFCLLQTFLTYNYQFMEITP